MSTPPVSLTAHATLLAALGGSAMSGRQARGGEGTSGRAYPSAMHGNFVFATVTEQRFCRSSLRRQSQSRLASQRRCAVLALWLFRQ